MQIPDLTERVIGFRQWTVGNDCLLRPAGKTDAPPWEPGPQLAQCYVSTLGMRTSCVPVVNDDCHCGFYALHNLYDAESYGGLEGGSSVQGIVTAWGRLAVHRDGFRAQYIELMAIIAPPRVKKGEGRYAMYKAVANKYNVPLMEYDRAEAFAEEFGKKVPDFLRPGSENDDEDVMLIMPTNKNSLSRWRQQAVHEARRYESEKFHEDFPGIPEWIVDVAMEIDPECPEAMAGLYDIYVPNVGDTLLAIVETPTPTYIAFPPDPIVPSTIDPTMATTFTQHLCTNGAVAYLPRVVE